MASENESQLAGVIAHEMAHSAARHARRLANKGRTFSIVQLAAMIGLQVFAPGLFYAGSYLGYYLKGLLLQAIFNGMGLVFTIDALGVSRDFELEADQLGMQYAWKSGYDPCGFIDLFDQMSQKEGYASRTSFFATHPAYGDRTLSALKEYQVPHSLTPERQYLTDTSEFQEMKERLPKSLIKTPKEIQSDVQKTTLKGAEPGPEECEELLSPTGNPAPGPSGKKQAGFRGPSGCK
jgi:predicted Zn-dependent protease